MDAHQFLPAPKDGHNEQGDESQHAVADGQERRQTCGGDGNDVQVPGLAPPRASLHAVHGAQEENQSGAMQECACVCACVCVCVCVCECVSLQAITVLHVQTERPHS